MDKHKPNLEEQPREEVAKAVTTPKRRYFLPTEGISVDADSTEDAVRQAKTATNKKAKE